MDNLTLEGARAHIEQTLLRTLTTGMQVAAAFGLGMAALLWAVNDGLDTFQNTRVVLCALFGVMALIGLTVSRLRGVQAAARFLVISCLLFCLLAAWHTGTGVMSATLILPAAMIMIAGFVLGPRAGQITSLAAVGLVSLLWAAQSQGWIAGIQSANAPRPMAYGLMLIMSFAMMSGTVSQYSRLLWRLITGMERHRQDLEDQVAVQKTMQARLEEGQHRLHTLLSHAPIALVVMDKDTGEACFANEQALKVHGAQTLDELISVCAYGESPYSREDMLTLVHRARDEGSLTHRWRSRTVEGEVRWWSVRLDLMSLTDQPQMVIFGQDITESLKQEAALLGHRQDLERQVLQRTAELRSQQHRLASVIEALPMALTIKDREGRFVLCNRRFEEIFGLPKAMLIGCSPDELFPPALAARLQAHEQTLLETSQMVRFENTLMGRDGTPRDQLVTKVPLLDDHQRPEAILTVAVDITDQKALQRELATAKTEAERLGQVKSEFLANMSHEIRTPLHGILGMAQVAQGSPGVPTEAQEALDRIRRSGQHLMGVIDDILDFSRLDAGKLHVEQRHYAPAQMARDVCDLVQKAAQDKGLRLEMCCEPSPHQVLGDPLRTRQILFNLMSNAIKFTQHGSVTLHLRATPDTLVFDVIDTGIGMPSDAQHRVFSPFEQVDSSTSRRFGGTGLGLSISRHLARLQGGDINLRSSEGQGSTFTLSLPLTLAQGMDPAPPVAAPSPDAEEGLRGLRILAADDVDINREILSSLLHKRGAEVLCVENGLEAVQAVAAQGPGHYSIVLMDIQMPVMDGLEATGKVLALDPQLPVLALTAHALPEESDRCIAAGMAGHLAKPFDVSEMVNRILSLARQVANAPRVKAQTPAGNLSTPTPSTETSTAAPHVDPARTRLHPGGSAPEVTMELDKALARCGGQEALLRKLLAKFVTQQADFVQRHLGDASLDTEQLGRAVHQLKGTAANLGLPELSACAAALESSLRADSPASPSALQTEWAAVGQSLAHHVQAVQVWLKDPVAA
jgi:PAS domain S-box-containing protein